MKRITLIVLVAAMNLFIIYQFQKPTLAENDAIQKAKEYVGAVNAKMNSAFDTEKPAHYSVLVNDTAWNKVIGNRQWSIMIGDVAVSIKADTGEFVQMVFPLDGVITELP